MRATAILCMHPEESMERFVTDVASGTWRESQFHGRRGRPERHELRLGQGLPSLRNRDEAPSLAAALVTKPSASERGICGERSPRADVVHHPLHAVDQTGSSHRAKDTVMRLGRETMSRSSLELLPFRAQTRVRALRRQENTHVVLVPAFRDHAHGRRRTHTVTRRIRSAQKTRRVWTQLELGILENGVCDVVDLSPIEADGTIYLLCPHRRAGIEPISYHCSLKGN